MAVSGPAVPPAAPALLPSDDRALLELAGTDPDGSLDAPLFGDESWLRRVSAEPVLLFGGGRALLLEIAHPLVAAGVSEHSQFRTDPFGRLRRTLDALSRMVLGSRRQAIAAARDIEAAHARVRGSLRAGTAALPAGTPYHGRDPELVRWVWATLVDTAWVVYGRFIEPLDPQAREAFYADHSVVGRLMGTPPEAVPPDARAFRDWFDGVVAGELLEVTPTAREIADAVFRASGSAPEGRLLRSITAGLLPERLRSAFGLPWDAGRARRLEELIESVRALRRPSEPAPSPQRRR